MDHRTFGGIVANEVEVSLKVRVSLVWRVCRLYVRWVELADVLSSGGNCVVGWW